MAESSADPVHLVAGIEPDRVVLRGRPTNLRGHIRVANDGDRTVAAVAPRATLTPESGTEQALTFTNRSGSLVRGGTERDVSLRARTDPHTPPGTYLTTIDVGATTVEALLEVVEDVALTLAPTSVVIDGVSGPAGSAAVIATNRGNVALAISQVGPIDLEVDGTRPTLLDRVLGRQLLSAPPAAIVDVDVHVHTAESDDEEDDEDDEPPAQPSVTGLIKSAVVLEPGDTSELIFSFEIDGDLEPGRRYRAVAPLHTTDLEIVVVPHQEGASFEAARTPSAPPRRTRKKAAAKSSRNSPGGSAAKKRAAKKQSSPAPSKQAKKSAAASPRRRPDSKD